ncbi:MAG: hypothetical protein OIN87_04250 [Candidatus Methanoperedens sp.]|nr:hypothetical protein [Candidatus Methanoperedens sp.]
MGIKISMMLIVFLLPALMSGASADIYVENASVINFSLNIASVELNSSIHDVRSRIFTDDADDAFSPNLMSVPSGLNSSINTVRIRIFTDDADDAFAPNLMSVPSGLDSSINTVQSRIFTDDADGLLHSLMAPYFPLPPPNNSIDGDMDGDGVIDKWDRENNTTPGFWVNPLGIGRMLGDLNGNGILDSGDVTILMQKIVGMMT